MRLESLDEAQSFLDIQFGAKIFEVVNSLYGCAAYVEYMLINVNWLVRIIINFVLLGLIDSVSL